MTTATATKPARIQRKRTKGWRKPDGAINVGRVGRGCISAWGNPWKEGSTGWTVLPGGWIDRRPHPPLTRQQAVDSYINSSTHDIEELRQIREQLRGKTLMCWCKVGEPCHGDWLFEVANSDKPLEEYLDNSPKPADLDSARYARRPAHLRRSAA
ncbi:DUF4326 domain-containing protein [Streptomyces ipomoeae]|uniref:DUF4326 domain-containing protein n=1 Tax=Streptomyces ipomoeae TaxID=103232 RepID=UPI0011467582|nr:DUF4326 domain-containing protein [Streptomyces ipomoeae]TQE33106.1 DUF4326 domain-containing protein [Streptomyces ipomoeae]